MNIMFVWYAYEYILYCVTFVLCWIRHILLMNAFEMNVIMKFPFIKCERMLGERGKNFSSKYGNQTSCGGFSAEMISQWQHKWTFLSTPPKIVEKLLVCWLVNQQQNLVSNVIHLFRSFVSRYLCNAHSNYSHPR